MPRLPKGVFVRKGKGRSGRRYYTRTRDVEGKQAWVALGDNLEVAKERLKDVKARGSVPTTRATMRELAKKWLNSYVAVRRIERNAKSTETRTEEYMLRFFGDTRARNVTKDDLRDYRVYLEGKGLKDSTVRLYLADSACLFHWAADSGYLPVAPVPRGLLPRLKERAPDALTDDEVERIIALPEPFGFACRLALGTGMRWGELIRAQRSDISRNGVLTIAETKGGRVRRVPLPPDLFAECQNRIGKLVPWTRECSESLNKNVRKLAELPRFHCHQMRHTYATRFLARGGSLAVLQQLMGHVDLSTTLHYGRPSDDVVRREVERVLGNGYAKGVASV